VNPAAEYRAENSTMMRPARGGEQQGDPVDRVAEVDVPDCRCDLGVEAVEGGAGHACRAVVI